MKDLLHTLIQLDKKSKEPSYLQLARQVSACIRNGYLKAGDRLPGIRQFADLFDLHRNTVANSFRLLEDQGWIRSEVGSGTVVSGQNLEEENVRVERFPSRTAYSFKRSALFDNPIRPSLAEIRLNEGLPDTRLSEIEEVAKRFQTAMRRRESQHKLRHDSFISREFYTRNLCNYLNRSRGLRITQEHLSIFRTQEMGLYALVDLLLEPHDTVLVGELSNFASNMILQQSGARLKTLPLDGQGICTEALALVCKRQCVRLLYLNPHHHFPTGAVLSAQRRKEILELAHTYGFIILEDDYGFDFAYEPWQSLPLAAQDHQGHVIYMGTLGQSIPSAFRSGYLVAPPNLIQELDKRARVMDRYGDALGEWTLGELLQEGELQRYLNRSTPLYKERRDLLATELLKMLGHRLSCDLPTSGLGMWLSWEPRTNLYKIAKQCAREGLHIPPYLLYQSARHAGMRMGFGNLSLAEISRAVQILYSVCEK